MSNTNARIYYVFVGITLLFVLGIPLFVLGIPVRLEQNRECFSGNFTSEQRNQKPNIKNPENIREIAKKSIVFITLGSRLKGSGVIICQTTTALFILTSIHVIGIEPSPKVDLGDGKSPPPPGDPYFIYTYDRQKFEVTHDNYKQDLYEFSGATDLVILKLDNSNSLNDSDRVARLTNQVQKDMVVYVMGYLPCVSLLNDITDETIQFSEGKVLSVEFKPETSEQGLKGYDIKHSSNTVQGMSGSPMFDESGRVLGIHAATEKYNKKFDAENCHKMPEESDRDNFGDNWGISIKKFAQIQDSRLRYILRPQSILSKEKFFVDKLPLSGREKESPPCPPFIGVDETDCLE
ncbi:MAG: serine protease [Xenococcus sp. (in: cyanobacteria)]